MINCFVMLSELQKKGVDNAEVARRLGKYPSLIEYWKDPDHIPRADNYFLLLHLYFQVVQPPEIQVLVSSRAYKVVVTPAI